MEKNLKRAENSELLADPKKGVFYSRGVRFLFVPASFVKEINSELRKIVGPSAAKILLYKFGESLGGQYGKTLKKILAGKKNPAASELLINEGYNLIFSNAGLGEVKITFAPNNKILAEIADSPSSALFKKSEYDFERGVLAGIHKEIFSKKTYYKFVSRKKKENSAKFINLLRIPRAEEKLILIERRELKDKIKEKTSELEEAREVLEIKVQARTRELKELAAVLEEKVRKRTSDLEKTRAALLNILEDVEAAKTDAEEERDKTLSIINNLADGLLVFNNEKRLILINPRASVFFGLEREAAAGRSVAELAKLPAFLPLAGLLEKSAAEIFRKELAAGEDMSLEVSTTPILSGGKKLGRLVILHDVTREKMVERMKTEFVSLSAHQLRTPLSAIKWTLKMILDGDLGQLNQEQKDSLAKAYLSNERMIELINDLLNLARIEEGRYLYKLAPAPIEAAIQSSLDSRRPLAAAKKIKVFFQKPENALPKIMLDAEKIGLAIENILENAIKYTLPGGQIVISLQNAGNEIQFSVKDTGIGIPKAQQQRVFSKFFRGGNAIRLETDGTGLGLFIAKNIIEAHGGRIWFESEENNGTTFYVVLPVGSK